MSEDVVEDAEEGEDTVPVVSDPEHVHDPLLHDDELSLLLLRTFPPTPRSTSEDPESIRPTYNRARAHGRRDSCHGRGVDDNKPEQGDGDDNGRR